MMMLSKPVLLCWALLPGLVRGLDVKLMDYSCDQNLPVTAMFEVKCDNHDRCTFGNDAHVFGNCKSLKMFGGNLLLIFSSLNVFLFLETNSNIQRCR